MFSSPKIEKKMKKRANLQLQCCLFDMGTFTVCTKYSCYSVDQVPRPSILDPAEKYISLIVPAYNLEHRLPGAIDETMK